MTKLEMDEINEIKLKMTEFNSSLRVLERDAIKDHDAIEKVQISVSSLNEKLTTLLNEQSKISGNIKDLLLCKKNFAGNCSKVAMAIAIAIASYFMHRTLDNFSKGRELLDQNKIEQVIEQKKI